MKKIFLTVLAALVAVGLALVSLPSDVQAATHEIWLGANVARVEQTESVWQSAVQVGKGYSHARWAIESVDGTQNKFLRMANFDGVFGTTETGVTVAMRAVEGEAQVLSFRYRLKEGAHVYGKDVTVLTIGLDGRTYELTTDELALTAQGEYGWSRFTLALEASEALGDRMTLTYCFGQGAHTDNYLDLDDLSVMAGTTERILSGDFSYADASAQGSKVTDLNTETNSLASKAQYMLATDKITSYGVNTHCTGTVTASFDGGTRTAALVRRASFGTSQGTASGESDTYAVYDASSDNTYLRLGNFNGTTTTQTRFTMYFHSPLTGDKENMPRVNQIYISMRYRLYLDDTARVMIDANDAVISMSTRSSNAGKSGDVYLEELEINEPGDDTWHEFDMILQTQVTTTEYLSFLFLGQTAASYTTGTYLDVDDFVMATPDGDNYSHLHGTFEGLVPELVEDDPLNGHVYFDTTLGPAGEKVALNTVNYGMELESKESVSVRTALAPVSNVYYVAFDVTGGDKLGLYLSGRTGKYVSLTVGKNASQDDLRAAWSSTEDGYRCELYVACLSDTVMHSIGFVNDGNAVAVIDNVTIGQVRSVSDEAGNYTAYRQQLDALNGELEASLDGYRRDAQKQIRLALIAAQRITEYASQARMDAALTELTRHLVDANRKADLTALQEALAAADGVFAEHVREDYTRQSWIPFATSLKEAQALDGESNQFEVDKATEALNAAILGLTLADTPSDYWLVIGLGSGLIGVGGIAAVGAVLLTKKKRRESK